MKKITLKNFTLFTLLVSFAVITRLVPHWPNFTAVGASALFLGALAGFSATGLFVALAPLLITDLILGFHETMIPVYGAFALNVLFGTLFLQSKIGIKRTTGLALVSSMSFFIITNLGVWFLTPMYSKDLTGLLACFTLALPFYKFQLMGDLFYSLVLLSVYQVLNRQPRAVAVKA